MRMEMFLRRTDYKFMLMTNNLCMFHLQNRGSYLSRFCKIGLEFLQPRCSPGGLKPTHDKIDPYPNDKQSGEQAQPGKQLFRDNELGGKERDEPKGKHAKSMGNSCRQAQINGMLHCAA